MTRAFLLSMSLALAGCSLLEPEGSAADTVPATFTQAQENWEASAPPRYEFGYAHNGDATEYLILVERGVVTRVRESASGEIVDLSLGLTVDSLFSRLGEAYRSGAHVIEVEYTPSSGYPRYAAVDPALDVDGDEYGWTVLSLRALLPCSGC